MCELTVERASLSDLGLTAYRHEIWRVSSLTLQVAMLFFQYCESKPEGPDISPKDDNTSDGAHTEAVGHVPSMAPQ
jgi:hypothetical protein